MTMRRKLFLVFVVGCASLLGSLYILDGELWAPNSAYRDLSWIKNSTFSATNESGQRLVEDQNSSPRHKCLPRQNFVWIKVHKSGSSTTTPLFQRYSYFHNLTVMMPAHGGPILSWPIPPREGMYVKPRNGVYNALYQHSRYNKTWMEARFPSNTAYLAIIREPFSHFKSCFNYYRLPHFLKINTQNHLKTFLENPWSYKTEALSYGVRFDKTRNAQAFDMGFPLERSDDLDWARHYLDQLDKDFLLVMILEHLDESMVLLRRLMCWELKDIIVITGTRNSRGYSFKHYQPTATEMETYRQYSAVDFLMFERFNQSLWSKIQRQGPDFYDEVKHYRIVCTQVRGFCNKKNKSAHLIIPGTRWNPRYTFDFKFCRRLSASDKHYRTKIWKQLGYGDKINTGMTYNVRNHHGSMLKQARKNSREQATQ